MNNIYKKLSVILMLLSMIGCYTIGMNVVLASGQTANAVDGGGAYTCSGSDCYSLGTSGVRVAVLDKSGNIIGKTVDYWYYGGRVQFSGLTGIPVFFYNGDNDKENTKNINNTNNLRQNINNYQKKDFMKNQTYSFNSIADAMPGILTGMNNKFHWEYYYENGEKKAFGVYNCSGNNSIAGKNYDEGCSETKVNTRVANSTYTIMNRIYANFYVEEGKSYTNDKGDKFKNYEERYKYLDKILKDTGSGLTHNNLGSGDYYLQFEPLLAWEHGNVYGNGTSYNFYGTSSEFTKLRVLAGGYWDGKGSFFHAFTSNICGSFYRIGTVGVTSDKQEYIPNNLFTAVNNTNVGYDDMAQNLTNKTAYGVGFIYLDPDIFQRPCSVQVVNLINQNKFANGIDNVIKQYPKAEWLQSYKNYGFKDLSSLKDYLNTKTDKSCPPPSCNETASNYLKGGSTKGDLVTILSNTIKNLYNELQKNLKNDEVFIYKTYTLNGSYYSDKYCEIVSCSDLLKGHTSDETYLAKLYNLFPKFTALSKDLRDAMDGTLEPSCVSTPSCPVEPVTAKCDSNNSFTLQDTNLEKDMAKTDNSKKCLKNGYAYNDTDSNGTVIANTVQTSFDSEYGTSSNPGYCWESVKFNFPNSVTNITAGTIFKWSTNGNSYNAEDNLFGTMTVTRKCYLSKDYFSVKGKTIYSNWASMVASGRAGARISPEITINYSEAIPNNLSKKHKRLELKDKLNVSLSKFDMYINGKENDYGTDNNHVTYTDDNENYDVSQYVNNNPRTYTCGTLGNDCSEVKYVEMEATYNLTYGDAFKWYSNRSDKDTTTSKSKITNIEQYEEKDGILGPYRFIGYGLPTSFITPTNLAGKYDYGYELSTATGNGNLYAEVAHIGTKNKNGNTYHFDKMVKFAITDDDDNTNDKIVYSCGFDINNRIFGNEDEPCEEGKCDMPKGLDVVFRTIDLMDNSTKEELDRAFPGMSGTGRTMGANWSEIYDIEDPNEGAANIFSVLDSSIYNKEPMYHITLDVALIKEIRTLNDKVKGDPYSDKTEVTTDKAKDGEAGYYFGDLNEYGGGIRSLFLSYLYNNGELETSCIKSNKDNGGNERNSDCFKSLVID